VNFGAGIIPFGHSLLLLSSCTNSVLIMGRVLLEQKKSSIESSFFQKKIWNIQKQLLPLFI
jgi:hypothetical protein